MTQTTPVKNLLAAIGTLVLVLMATVMLIGWSANSFHWNAP
jgi:hypothetical protein